MNRRELERDLKEKHALFAKLVLKAYQTEVADEPHAGIHG